MIHSRKTELAEIKRRILTTLLRRLSKHHKASASLSYNTINGDSKSLIPKTNMQPQFELGADSLTL